MASSIEMRKISAEQGATRNAEARTANQKRGDHRTLRTENREIRTVWNSFRMRLMAVTAAALSPRAVLLDCVSGPVPGSSRVQVAGREQCRERQLRSYLLLCRGVQESSTPPPTRERVMRIRQQFGLRRDRREHRTLRQARSAVRRLRGRPPLRDGIQLPRRR